MLLQLGNPVITGTKMETYYLLFSASLSYIFNRDYISGFSYVGGVDSYQKSTWSLGENYIKEYNDWFLEQQTEFLLGRYEMVLMALSCFGLFLFSNMLTH